MVVGCRLNGTELFGLELVHIIEKKTMNYLWKKKLEAENIHEHMKVWKIYRNSQTINGNNLKETPFNIHSNRSNVESNRIAILVVKRKNY